MSDFKTILQTYGPLVAAEIERQLATAVTHISDQTNPEIEAFHQQICADYPQRGGKYIRPILLMLTAEALGTPVSQTVVTAAAMELAQNWLLIHDDIEDGSITRRGRPSLQHLYNTPLAINAGDALHILMWQVLCQNQDLIGAKKTLAVMGEFGQMLFRTTVGQTAELKLVADDRYDVTSAECLYVMDGKTGYYTFAGPMRLGALVASDDDVSLHNLILPTLNLFGTYMGRAFQIMDDLLDVTSDFGARKQRGNDIYESKRSLLLSHVLTQTSPTEHAEIISILSKPRAEKTAVEVEHVIDLMMQHGTLDFARQQAQMWGEQACEILDGMDFFVDETAVAHIKTITEFVVNRNF